MIGARVTDQPTGPRWGEGVLLVAAAPGLIAAATLVLAWAILGLGAAFGPVSLLLALPFIFTSPALVKVGAATLVAGMVAARYVPGRQRYKWAILIAGTLALAGAAYWESAIELP